VAGQVGGPESSHLGPLGHSSRQTQSGYTARIVYNTNWENELSATAVTHNHNLSFAAGEDNAIARRSTFMNQEGVAISTRSSACRGPQRDPQRVRQRLRLGSMDDVAYQERLHHVREHGGVRRRGVPRTCDLQPTQPVRVTTPRVVRDVLRLLVRHLVRTRCAGEPDQPPSARRPVSGNATAELDLVWRGSRASECGVGRSMASGHLPPEGSPVEPRLAGWAPIELPTNTTVTCKRC